MVEGVPEPEQGSSLQVGTGGPAGESADTASEQSASSDDSASGEAPAGSEASSGDTATEGGAPAEGGTVSGGAATSDDSGAKSDGSGTLVASAKGSSSDSATSGQTSSHAAGKKLRVRSSVSGCLTQKGGDSSDRSPSRAPMPRGRTGPDTFEVVPQKGAISVNQSFSHACCLTGKTSATVDGSVVTLTTVLSGTPCRCMCASTIQSSVSLSAGTYTLRIVHEQGTQKNEKHSQKVVVP